MEANVYLPLALFLSLFTVSWTQVGNIGGLGGLGGPTGPGGSSGGSSGPGGPSVGPGVPPGGGAGGVGPGVPPGGGAGGVGPDVGPSGGSSGPSGRLSYGCNSPTSMAPFPGDPSKFYQCASGGIIWIKDCAPGTHFNPYLHVCDWPRAE